MKYTILALAIFVSGSTLSFADDHQIDDSGNWFCTATGYDYRSDLQSVSGEYKATEEEARESAVQICRSFGYSVCVAQSCFNF